MSLGQHQSFWTLTSQFLPGIRIPRSWHFAVCTAHPSHLSTCLCLCPETPAQVPHLSQSSCFLCPLCSSPALRHITYGSVPPFVSNCKIKIVLVLAYQSKQEFASFPANHIYYVPVHLFAQWCMMSVRGSWMQNNKNTNRVRENMGK